MMNRLDLGFYSHVDAIKNLFIRLQGYMGQKSEPLAKLVEPICFNDSLIGCFQYQICTMESNEKPNLKKYLQKCSLNLLVSAYQIAN